jgi:CrcB protein
MDRGTTDSEPRRSESFSYTRSASSSCRRRSISFSASLPIHIGDDVESETVSEAGDIGDRALQSNRHSEDARLCFSIDHASQNRVASPTSEDTLLHPCGYWSRDPALNTISPVSPLPEEIISPLFVDAMVCSKDIKQVSLQLIVSHLVIIFIKRNS